MKLSSLLALTTLAVTPAFAEETRQLDSHEHGVGQLDIAIEGAQIAMELHAPGADIVGFEYEAESDADLAAIDAAVAALTQPLALFVLPDAAQCTVVEAQAGLEDEEHHDDHGDEDHDEHDGDAHEDHDDHAEEEGHDDHGDHDDHGEDDHAEAANHTEFHAQYLLTCGDITAVTDISFAYFTAFPNALEVEVQVISDAGATAFEVERDAPTLDLGDLTSSN